MESSIVQKPPGPVHYAPVRNLDIRLKKYHEKVYLLIKSEVKYPTIIWTRFLTA